MGVFKKVMVLQVKVNTFLMFRVNIKAADYN